MAKLKCVWNMGTPCSQDVEERPMFQGQIKVPVCGSHLEEHKYILILHRNHYDIEEVLQQSPEYRKGEVLILKLSGLDNGEIEP